MTFGFMLGTYYDDNDEISNFVEYITFDDVWVIVDRLTKSAHFIPIRMDYPLERLAELYIEKIVSLHGIHSIPLALA